MSKPREFKGEWYVLSWGCNSQSANGIACLFLGVLK